MQNFFSYLESKISKMSPILESRRIFHGRGKEFSNDLDLTLDYFPPETLLMTSYKNFAPEFIQSLKQYFKNQQTLKISNILMQNRWGDQSSFEVLEGTRPEDAFVLEESLKYAINFGHNQNIGFFLDMRLGRKWINENCLNLKILNLFSYTCSFSVAALHGGAREVINLDMSKTALKIGENNHRINKLLNQNVKFLAHDLFKTWGKLNRLAPFDLIILDPPFNQSSFRFESDFEKVLKRMPDLLSYKGRLFISINSPHHHWEDSQKKIEAILGKEFCLITKLTSPPEFIENELGSELKIFIYEKESAS